MGTIGRKSSPIGQTTMMRLPDRQKFSDGARDILETAAANSRERWQRFEDWAETLGDKGENVLFWLGARPRVYRWIVVLISISLSILIGLAFQNNVTTSSQLLLLLPAVLVCSLYAGSFEAVVAALIGGIATIHWKVSASTAPLEATAVSLLLYAMTCSIVIGLSSVQNAQRKEILGFAETLEGKVKDRTTELEKANEELSTFCYSISHDIRAPMRNIVASSRILLDDAGSYLDKDSNDRLVGLASSASKLSLWVDDLLDHARLSHLEFKPEWINVTRIADEVISQLEAETWQFSDVVTHIQPNLVTPGDRILVKLAMRRILENSFKYAQRGKTLVIDLAERKIGRKTFIEIRDNGVGFDQQYVKRIFEPFQRLHRDDEYPGSGIGLANVVTIVERHGGEILAEGHPGEGAAFRIRFGGGKGTPKTRLL